MKSMNKDRSSKVKSPFGSESAFRRKYLAYLDMCSGVIEGEVKGPKRIANTAGFCAWCGITGDEFRELKNRFPRAYDIMQSHFIDAAVNSKLPNTGPVLDYLLGSVNRFGDDGGGDYTVSIDGGFDEDSI